MLCLIAFACAACAQNAKDAATDDVTITIEKSTLDAIKNRLEELERELQDLKNAQNQSGRQIEPAAQSEPETTIQPENMPSAGGRQLALPEISLIVQAKGLASDDKNDPNRQKLQLSEAEIGIQGYVYPNVKADAFIAMSPAEDEPAQVEEAYLTYLGLTKGLNVNVGQKHVSFGRTNLLHNHSWPYTRQPLVITNFIAPESLTGQGANFSYLLPIPNFFAQLDVGVWANGSGGEESELPDVVTGPGANLTDRFETARLWTSTPTGDNGEIELGGSWAGGKSNEDPITLQTDYVHIKGIDLSYRRFGEGSKRLLLRGEQFWRTGTTDSDDRMTRGYYLLGQYRWDKYGSIGLLYDWSEFPQASDLHESAMSLIVTKQFSEQYYLRLQAIRGNRPDIGGYNEFWLQWCWGVGPHTHNLE